MLECKGFFFFLFFVCLLSCCDVLFHYGITEVNIANLGCSGSLKVSKDSGDQFENNLNCYTTPKIYIFTL